MVSPPVRPLAARLIDLALFVAVLGLLAISYRAVEMWRLGLVFSNGSKIGNFALGFAHVNTVAAGLWWLFVKAMWQTLQMALWGTVLAIALAVPLGLLAAKNVTPVWIQQPVRRLLDLTRSVPDIVIGYIFVVAVGLGPFAGVMALAINTGGVLAKLFSEAVEAIDPGPVEGVRAVGAGRLQEVIWGVLPQVAPLWTSFALYRFESNARSATVLGLIGAGGIGQNLIDSLNGYAYDQTAAIMIIIIVAVSLIDLLSQAIRSRLL